MFWLILRINNNNITVSRYVSRNPVSNSFYSTSISMCFKFTTHATNSYRLSYLISSSYKWPCGKPIRQLLLQPNTGLLCSCDIDPQPPSYCSGGVLRCNAHSRLVVASKEGRYRSVQPQHEDGISCERVKLGSVRYLEKSWTIASLIAVQIEKIKR